MKTLKTILFPKPPKMNHSTNKTYVYYIDNNWGIDILDLKEYGPENTKAFRYVLVVINDFSKFGWTASLKTKNAHTITNSFEKNS